MTFRYLRYNKILKFCNFKDSNYIISLKPIVNFQYSLFYKRKKFLKLFPNKIYNFIWKKHSLFYLTLITNYDNKFLTYIDHNLDNILGFYYKQNNYFYSLYLKFFFFNTLLFFKKILFLIKNNIFLLLFV